MAMNRIRALRKKVGYNQKELGNILGVGQTTVSAWEIGRNEPDSDSCNKMAKLFGCSIGYLMGYEPESKHRGLSDAEWDAFTARKHMEHEAEMYEEYVDRENAETEKKLAEYERYERLRAWEEGNREVFPETIGIDAILERTDADGRQRALKVIELMFPETGQ